ncbi:MAG: MFS transporter [Rhodobacteraceae bacterium]|nr:MFS transporter [Paracoccaceae bacterium]
MVNRWSILLVLFLARTAMAFQFQSVAALSPLLIAGYSVALVDIGLLVGLYLGPGVIIALAGGTLAARFGDKRIVAASLLVMFAGLLVMALGGGWGWLLAGRVLAGIGGVIVNVVLTKMLVDWFAGREIATAMAVLVSFMAARHRAGTGLVAALGEAGGLALAWSGVGTVILLALVFFNLIYRPALVDTAPATALVLPLPKVSLSLAALIWALYNTALAMVFSFGPVLLSSQGAAAQSASATISLFMLCLGLGIPLGGYLADRTGRRDGIMLLSFALCAAMLPAVLFIDARVSLFAYAFFGLIFGLPAGPVMTLPSEVLTAAQRALGMGVFFSIYYGAMMIGRRSGVRWPTRRAGRM